VKLGNVLSDVFGVSGQLMLALLERKAEPVEIAQLTKGRAQQRIPEIIQALEGHPLSEHHRQMIRYSVQHLEFVEAQMGDWTWPSPARSRRRAGTVMGTAADVAWGPGAQRGHDSGRNRGRYRAVSFGQVSELVGRSISGQPSQRGQEQEQPHDGR